MVPSVLLWRNVRSQFHQRLTNRFHKLTDLIWCVTTKNTYPFCCLTLALPHSVCCHLVVSERSKWSRQKTFPAEFVSANELNLDSMVANWTRGGSNNITPFFSNLKIQIRIVISIYGHQLKLFDRFLRFDSVFRNTLWMKGDRVKRRLDFLQIQCGMIIAVRNNLQNNISDRNSSR